MQQRPWPPGRGRLVGHDDPRAQVQHVFEHLAAVGATMEQFVKLTMRLTVLADLVSGRSGAPSQKGTVAAKDDAERMVGRVGETRKPVSRSPGHGWR